MTVDVQTPPAQVGFDAARLARIDRHFCHLRRRRPAARLADRGQPPRADRALFDVRDAGRASRSAGRAGHAVPDLLDDQADHVGGGDDALRGRRVRASCADRSGGIGRRAASHSRTASAGATALTPAAVLVALPPIWSTAPAPRSTATATTGTGSAGPPRRCPSRSSTPPVTSTTPPARSVGVTTRDQGVS